MLSVNSVSTYSLNYEPKTNNEAKKLPMEAVRTHKPKQEMSEYEKQKRKAKIRSAVVTTATVLGSLGFLVLIALQLVSMRPKGGVLDIVSNEEVAKHLGFDQMVQRPEMEAFWKRQINKINNADFFSKHFPNRGISMLFYGPPGTSKTESVYALKKYFGDKAILARIDCTSFKDSLHGSSEKKINRSLRDATELCKKNPNKKVIVLLDEMSIANKDQSINSELTQSMQDAFKANFLALLEQPNAIVIGTTNHADKNIPLDTFMNKAILDRFSIKQFFETPYEDQFLNLFEKRAGEWEAAGIVEKDFFAKNSAQFKVLAKEMEDGGASYRSYTLGVEERIKDFAAERYEREGLTGDKRNIVIDDIKNAVLACKKEENWGVKAEDKGINDDVIHSILSFFGKNNNVPNA